jgi:hypothetical protein
MRHRTGVVAAAVAVVMVAGASAATAASTSGGHGGAPHKGKVKVICWTLPKGAHGIPPKLPPKLPSKGKGWKKVTPKPGSGIVTKPGKPGKLPPLPPLPGKPGKPGKGKVVIIHKGKPPKGHHGQAMFCIVKGGGGKGPVTIGFGPGGKIKGHGGKGTVVNGTTGHAGAPEWGTVRDGVSTGRA